MKRLLMVCFFLYMLSFSNAANAIQWNLINPYNGYKHGDLYTIKKSNIQVDIIIQLLRNPVITDLYISDENGILNSVITPDYMVVDHSFDPFIPGFEQTFSWDIEGDYKNIQFSLYLNQNFKAEDFINAFGDELLIGITDSNGYALNGAPVPEPATIFILSSGLIGLYTFRKKLRYKSHCIIEELK